MRIAKPGHAGYIRYVQAEVPQEFLCFVHPQCVDILGAVHPNLLHELFPDITGADAIVPAELFHINGLRKIVIDILHNLTEPVIFPGYITVFRFELLRQSHIQRGRLQVHQKLAGSVGILGIRMPAYHLYIIGYGLAVRAFPVPPSSLKLIIPWYSLFPALRRNRHRAPRCFLCIQIPPG